MTPRSGEGRARMEGRDVVGAGFIGLLLGFIICVLLTLHCESPAMKRARALDNQRYAWEQYVESMQPLPDELSGGKP